MSLRIQDVERLDELQDEDDIPRWAQQLMQEKFFPRSTKMKRDK
jgi:hypothetical protein